MEHTLERLNAIHELLLDSLDKNISRLSESADAVKSKALAKTIQSLSAAQYSIIESIDLISNDPFAGISDFDDDHDFLADTYPDVIEFKDTKKSTSKKKKKKK